MKNNLSYFKRDADSFEQTKFMKLKAKYGWAGEGRFWALYGIIASSDNCRLNIADKYTLGMLAYRLGMAEPELQEFIGFVVQECELLTFQDGYITSQELQENLAIVQADRKRARERRSQTSDAVVNSETVDKGLPELSESTGEYISSSGESDDKVNKSKVNEIKINSCSIYNDESISEILSSAESLSETLCALYRRFLHEPDPMEVKTLIGEIKNDSRFTETQTLRIILKIFTQMPLKSPERKNTSYILGALRSIKQNILQEQSKKKYGYTAAADVRNGGPVCTPDVFRGIINELDKAKQAARNSSSEDKQSSTG